jgi:hypothetical protein
MTATRTPGITQDTEGRRFIDKRYRGIRVGIRVGVMTQKAVEERLQAGMQRVDIELPARCIGVPPSLTAPRDTCSSAATFTASRRSGCTCVCWGLSQFIMLACCGYIVYGTWLQHDILRGNASPVAQISMIWVFGVSYLTGGAIGLICLSNLLRLFAGRVRDDELVDVHEEGMADAEEAQAEMEAHPLVSARTEAGGRS